MNKDKNKSLFLIKLKILFIKNHIIINKVYTDLFIIRKLLKNNEKSDYKLNRLFKRISIIIMLKIIDD